MNLHDREFKGLRHTSKVIPVSERPVCQSCGKTLPLRSVLHAPMVDGRLDKSAACLSAKAKAWSAVRMKDGSVDRLDYWEGEYGGYGLDKDRVPLFCTLRCGVVFAEVLYRAGRRLNFNGKRLSRGD